MGRIETIESELELLQNTDPQSIEQAASRLEEEMETLTGENWHPEHTDVDTNELP